MMRLLFLLLGLLSAEVAIAERNLPADVQIDLIFPRNETYAPTQHFPIVIGIKNLDAVWPMDSSLTVTIQSISSWSDPDPPSWTWDSVGFLPDLVDADGDAPDTSFFHFPAVNMTNGTTDNYFIRWHYSIPYRCFDNATDPEDHDGARGWSSMYSIRSPREYYSHALFFSTAPRAQLPDIEATVNSCSEANANYSAAVRITEMKMTYDWGDEKGSRPCPVLEDIEPAKCLFESSAKDLAADVNAAMLDMTLCKEGTWQTITAPCPREENMALPQTVRFGVGWGLLPLAFAVSRIL